MHVGSWHTCKVAAPRWCRARRSALLGCCVRDDSYCSVFCASVPPFSCCRAMWWHCSEPCRRGAGGPHQAAGTQRDRQGRPGCRGLHRARAQVHAVQGAQGCVQLMPPWCVLAPCGMLDVCATIRLLLMVRSCQLNVHWLVHAVNHMCFGMVNDVCWLLLLSHV